MTVVEEVSALNQGDVVMPESSAVESSSPAEAVVEDESALNQGDAPATLEAEIEVAPKSTEAAQSTDDDMEDVF